MNKLTKLKITALSIFLPVIGFCQDEVPAQTTTYLSNALFITLLITIILLLIVILAFSNVLKNVADSEFFDKKLKADSENNSSTGKIVSTMLFCLMSFSLMAQNNKPHDWSVGGVDSFTFYFMLFVILLELIVLGLLIYQFKFLLKSKTEKAAEASRVGAPLMQSLTGAVPVEDEESILLDHNYDGIKELDNDLPPWWKYGFYLTIVVAVVYVFNYHVSGTGDLQIAEYDKEMAQAKIDVEDYMKTSANKVDESSVKLLVDAKELASGKESFLATCAACHGRTGEGGVGPNLTDPYWLHGGSIQDVFKSIKYGWTEKGMKSWKDDLSPMQIAQVASYVLSLKGTNPANPKAPQGDLYTEKAYVVSDSASVKNDSLHVVLKPDSLNKSETK